MKRTNFLRSHFYTIRNFLLGMGLLFFIGQRPFSAAAQTSTTYYWQYPASGRLHDIIPVDIDQDGVDEILIIDESGKTDLLQANGSRQWSYLPETPVLATTIGNILGGPEHEIVLATRRHLILLQSDGQVVWRTQLIAAPPPLVMLTGGDEQTAQNWLSRQTTRPVALATLDAQGDGLDEIVVVQESGYMQLYDAASKLLWQYSQNSRYLSDVEPHMVVGDLDGDGLSEIVLGVFNPGLRFSQVMLVNRTGQPVWDQEQSVSGHITAVSLVRFSDPQQQYIAIGTNLGNVNLYNAQRQRLWPRTLNKPITSLTGVQSSGGPILVAGTTAGSLVAFDEQGFRVWTRNLDNEARSSILNLSAVPVTSDSSQQPVLSAVVGLPEGEGNPADVVLLSGNGRPLKRISAVDTTGLSRLININRDAHNELLLARFATVELQGLGIGANDTARDWEYALFSTPRSFLVVDFDDDGADELLVGAQDGRLHRINNEGLFRWVVEPGNAVTDLAVVPHPVTFQPQIVVVRNDEQSAAIGNTEPASHWLELRQPNGEQVWEIPFSQPITTLYIADINERAGPEIIVGTEDGRVVVFSPTGTQIQDFSLDQPISHLLVVTGVNAAASSLIAATGQELFKLQVGMIPQRLGAFSSEIRGIFAIVQPGLETRGTFLVMTADGQVSGLTDRAQRLSQWSLALNGRPAIILPADQPFDDTFRENTSNAFLVATEEGQLLRLSFSTNQSRILWALDELGTISSVYWGDIDGDGLPDFALGRPNGQVSLYTREPAVFQRLDVFSNVFAVTTLRRQTNQTADLLTITNNGLVQLFRAQDNWPPLLINPEVDAVPGRYSIELGVNNLEGDNLLVRLEVRDPVTGIWMPQEEKNTANTMSTFFWILDALPEGNSQINYRFYYNDGFHEGFLTPPPGPAPIPPSPLSDISQVNWALFSIAAIGGFLLLVRQMQSQTVKARRLYRRISQQPVNSLPLLEQAYMQTEGSPDFLLNVANVARQRNDRVVANLADGLYLLAARPFAALSIINSTLRSLDQSESVPLTDWRRWRETHSLNELLLQAPSITELSLLLPQLDQLLQAYAEETSETPGLRSLLPILTNLRDSERVELAEDRLVYLNEASQRLAKLRETLEDLPVNIETTLVTAVAKRSLGLISAAIEELRGQADLQLSLKTKRIILTAETEIVVEIRNRGRAPAENLLVILDESPAYTIQSAPYSLPFLPPGHTRQINLGLQPEVNDRFRLGVTVYYDDRNQQGKTTAFGDMVHILPPVREFHPIFNPYLPGTPLRSNSDLFFGRQELFEFINDNATKLSGRNILILIGQRRTGKTSLLLRLHQHLPERLLPVYIDCQALGVIPGMPALLHELAWLIADTLSNYGITITVPEIDAWQSDPTRLFQKQYLPSAQQLLPTGTTLLLVFDEFEAFENLVRDKILPPTLFPYLRHLMQHSEGLSFIFVGTRRLEEMSSDYWSVLFNIALYHKIGYLNEAAANRLISEPVKPNLVYDDLAIDKILRVTNGHPYFLQLVCYTLVKRANSQRSAYATISDVNAALEEMLRLGEVHFAYLWQRSLPAERALLTAMAHLMDQDEPFHPSDLVQYLEPYGIHLDPNEVTAALNSLVDRDIISEVAEATATLYVLQIGLVGLWVTQNKSLSKLHSGDANKRKAIPQVY